MLGQRVATPCEPATVYQCCGVGSTAEYMRGHGIGVIHGVANSLHFTPPPTSPVPERI
jgi:hypothetical protein